MRDSQISRGPSVVHQVAIADVYERLTGYAAGNRKRRTVRVLCPRYEHQERNPSCDLNLDDNVWHCHSCKGGGGIITMVLESGILSAHLAGNERLRATYLWLEELAGGAPRTWDLRPQPAILGENNRIVARVTQRLIFPYRDSRGTVRYEEIRIEGFDRDGARAKDVYARVPLPDGKWYRADKDTWHRYDASGKRVCIDGTPLELPNLTRAGTPRKRLPNTHLHTLAYSTRLPYRLPELLADTSGDLHVTEGPKKADNLHARTGLTSTTWFGGAKRDPEGDWERYFAHIKRVIIWMDDDRAGRDAGQRRARYFLSLGKTVTTVAIANTGDGDDVDDWLNARPTASQDELRSDIAQMLAHRPWMTS